MIIIPEFRQFSATNEYLIFNVFVLDRHVGSTKLKRDDVMDLIYAAEDRGIDLEEYLADQNTFEVDLEFGVLTEMTVKNGVARKCVYVERKVVPAD